MRLTNERMYDGLPSSTADVYPPADPLALLRLFGRMEELVGMLNLLLDGAPFSTDEDGNRQAPPEWWYALHIDQRLKAWGLRPDSKETT